MERLCDYGCGRKATHYFRRVKKWCCCKDYGSCPANKERQKQQNQQKKKKKKSIKYKDTKNLIWGIKDYKNANTKTNIDDIKDIKNFDKRRQQYLKEKLQEDLENELKKNEWKKPKSIRVDDVTYDSVAEACRKTGLHWKKIYQKVRSNKPEDLGTYFLE